MASSVLGTKSEAGHPESRHSGVLRSVIAIGVSRSVAVLVLAICTGCRAPSVMPASGSKPPSVPSWTEPRASEVVLSGEEEELWAEARESDEAVVDSGDLYVDLDLEAYLQGVLDDLVPAGLPSVVPRPTIRVVPRAGRFATVSAIGSIYVSTSLLAAFRNEAQLAAVLGHEIAHFLDRDSYVELLYRGMTSSTVDRMALSRKLEAAADVEALQLMQAAGYESLEIFEALRLLKEESEAYQGEVLAWESHPGIDARARRLSRRAELVGAPTGRKGTAEYDSAVANLVVDAGEIELDAGLYDRARETIDRAIALHPSSARPRFLMAEVLRKTEREGKRAPAVLENYEIAVELDPESSEALRALGLLLWDLGEREQARPVLRSYLSAAPEAIDRKIIRRYLDSPES